MEPNNKILVDEYDNLQNIKKDIENKIEKVKKELISLSITNNTNILFGTHKKCSIKEFEKVIYPEDKEILISTIKNKGLYEQFSSLNYFKLGPKILKGEIDKDIIDLVKKERDFRISLIDRGI